MIIRNASIEDVYSIGQSVDLVHDWEEKKLDVMFNGNWLKITQNESLKEKLVKSVGEIYVPCDAFGSLFWGSGIKGEGKNWNGKILMAIRDRLNGIPIDDFLFEKQYESFCLKMKK